MMKRYLSILTLAPALMIIVILMLEVIVDPYAQFELVESERLNKFKTAAPLNERLYKTSRMYHTAPDMLVLGTSREDYGIDPDDLKQLGTVYNGASKSQSYRESRMALEYLHAHHRYPKRIMLGLLYEVADIYDELPSDYDEERLYGGFLSKIKFLFSLNMIRATVKTASSNIRGASQQREGYSRNGLGLPITFEPSLNASGHHKLFTGNEKHYFSDQHFRLPLCLRNTLDDAKTGYSKLDEIRQLVRLAYTQKSEVKIFFGPAHARQWQTLKASGLWDDFEEWKRRVVLIVEEEAMKADAEPFQVWDFSGYNSVTTEALPPSSDMDARMKFYYESSHYTPAAGRLVIERMYRLGSSGQLPDDFGLLLNSANLQARLREIRQQQAVWEKSHAADVREISELKAKTDSSKGCP